MKLLEFAESLNLIYKGKTRPNSGVYVTPNPIQELHAESSYFNLYRIWIFGHRAEELNAYEVNIERADGWDSEFKEPTYLYQGLCRDVEHFKEICYNVGLNLKECES